MSILRPTTAATGGTALSFEDRYRETPDPWHFADSEYEQRRYRTVMESLPRLCYGRAFEPGCSVGELTAQLAEVCGHVVATDVAPTAVQRARQRCRGFENVDIRCADLACEIPAGPFDLVVFSEIGYYFPASLLVNIARAVAGHLNLGGDFVAVHWLGHSADHVLHGDEVHEQLLTHLPLNWRGGQRYDGFRIDSWRRT